MKRVLQYISLKTLILTTFVLLCFLLIGILSLMEMHMKRSLTDQKMAERWSEKRDAVQISAFYSEKAVDSSSFFRGVEQSVEQALVTASITSESENENARLWIDSISRKGKVNLESELGKMEVNAVGIQREFFQFHPLQLVSGTYISADSLMQDGIVIDEETAWHLFGSSDVAGMQVVIKGVPHIIIGVFQRPQGRIQEAAGLNKPICFLGLESLEKYGEATGGYFYEIVLPNPIKGFGLSTMNTLLEAEKTEVKVVENTTRYGVLSLFEILKNFGTRSMSQENIIYPYWENIAKGYEDIFVLLFLLKIMLMIYPVLFFSVIIVKIYKGRKWSLGGLINLLGEKYYEMGTKKREKK